MTEEGESKDMKKYLLDLVDEAIALITHINNFGTVFIISELFLKLNLGGNDSKRGKYARTEMTRGLTNFRKLVDDFYYNRMPKEYSDLEVTRWAAGIDYLKNLDSWQLESVPKEDFLLLKEEGTTDDSPLQDDESLSKTTSMGSRTDSPAKMLKFFSKDRLRLGKHNIKIMEISHDCSDAELRRYRYYLFKKEPGHRGHHHVREAHAGRGAGHVQ